MLLSVQVRLWMFRAAYCACYRCSRPLSSLIVKFLGAADSFLYAGNEFCSRYAFRWYSEVQSFPQQVTFFFRQVVTGEVEYPVFAVGRVGGPRFLLSKFFKFGALLVSRLLKTISALAPPICANWCAASADRCRLNPISLHSHSSSSFLFVVVLTPHTRV